MTLRSTILIRIGLLIFSMALALSGTFYWIFVSDVRQRSQQTVDAAFSLLKDSLHRKQWEMAREAEKVNSPIRVALDQIETVRGVTLPPQADTRLSYLKKVAAQSTPLADHLYTLSDALGRDGLRIALYDRRGSLLMVYTADNGSNQTVCLYLPELRPDALLVLRRKAVLVGASLPRTILTEDRLNQLTDPDDLETAPLPQGLPLCILAKAVSGTSTARFFRLGQGVALQYRAPVHGIPPSFDYFVPVDKVDQTEPNNGLLELTMQLQAGDIQQIAAMTHTEINTFADNRLACGTLHTYTRLEGETTGAINFSGFVGNPPVNRIVPRMVANTPYYESRMTVDNGDGAVGTIAVLLSRQAEQHAAMVLFLSISGAAVAFGIVAGVDVMRFSNSIARPVSRIVSSMQQLARGEPTMDRAGSMVDEQAGFSEVKQMSHALDDLIKAHEETMILAEAIAGGDLNVQITPRSKQDRLICSLNRMVQQLNEHHGRAMRANQTLAETNRILETLSATDALTGIANRRQFDEVLAREHARHARSGADLSLILLDIDFFKAFNDLYGHPEGDTCLHQIGAVLADCSQRPSDLAARYGGEEFACILPETDQPGALLIAERIRRMIVELAIPHTGSQVSDVITASLGVLTVHCSSTMTAAELLAQADTLLYQAKSAGRNRVVAA